MSHLREDGPRLVMTIPQLARSLQVDRATAYRWLVSGVLPIPVLRMVGTARVRTVDVERYLQQLADDTTAAKLPTLAVRRKANAS